MLSTDTFVINSRYRDYVHGLLPRPTDWSAALFGCFTLFLLPFLATGLAVVLFALHEWRLWAGFNSTPTTVTAIILDKGIEPDSEGADDPYLVYTYVAPSGRELANYTDKIYVSEHDYRRIERGGTVEIHYLPGNPQETRLPGTSSLGAPLFLTAFALFWNGMAWGMFLFLLRQSWTSLLLARRGQLVHGTVTSYETSTDSDGDLWVKVGYSFVAPDGRFVEGREHSIQNGMKDVPHLAHGTPVAVLYADPKHHKLL